MEVVIRTAVPKYWEDELQRQVMLDTVPSRKAVLRDSCFESCGGCGLAGLCYVIEMYLTVLVCKWLFVRFFSDLFSSTV